MGKSNPCQQNFITDHANRAPHHFHGIIFHIQIAERSVAHDVNGSVCFDWGSIYGLFLWC